MSTAMKLVHHDTNEIVIERGIPVPQTRGRNLKYRFADMQIDDSFALPDTEAKNLRAAASAYRRRNPDWNYTIRAWGDDKVRLWRQ